MPHNHVSYTEAKAYSIPLNLNVYSILNLMTLTNHCRLDASSANKGLLIKRVVSLKHSSCKGSQLKS